MKKIIKVFLMAVPFIFSTILSTNIAYAEEIPYDYQFLVAGSCLKDNGFVFSEPGMANLYLSINEKIKLAVAGKQQEINTIKIDLDACGLSKVTELRIQREIFEEKLRVKQSVIDTYKADEFWANIRTVGYVILGIGVGVVVGKYIIPK